MNLLNQKTNHFLLKDKNSVPSSSSARSKSNLTRIKHQSTNSAEDYFYSASDSKNQSTQRDSDIKESIKQCASDNILDEEVIDNKQILVENLIKSSFSNLSQQIIDEARAKSLDLTKRR